MRNRFIAWQNARDTEEAGLHDRIDASAHPNFLGERISIDRIKANLFPNYLLLHFARQLVPYGRRISGCVQKKHCALRGVFEHIDLVDELELMAGDEFRLVN